MTAADDSAQLLSYSASFSQTPDRAGGRLYRQWRRRLLGRGRQARIRPPRTGLFAEEDQVDDSERSHADEGFGFLAIEPPDSALPGTQTVEPLYDLDGNLTAGRHISVRLRRRKPPDCGHAAGHGEAA